MDFESAYNHIMRRLEHEIPDHFTYHNAAHTKSVIAAVESIGQYEEVEKDEIIILKTAALFHDAGFLLNHKDHEENSCAMAHNVLPAYGYSVPEINNICRLIMATKWPHVPINKLQEIICDADLHYIGTNKYLSTANNLYSELKHLNLIKSRGEWQHKQVTFLSTHRFFTKTAQNMYGVKKEQNLKSITHYHNKKQIRFDFLHDMILMILGTLIAGFALKGFLLPNRFFDGGVTGLSLLLHELYHIDISYLIIILNFPLVVVAYFTVSKNFAFKTVISVILLSLFLLLIPYPIITSDKLLISIFGGVFLGLGNGLTMRAGCALDGIEVLAVYTLKRTSFSITEIILGINIIIFGIAAFKFGIETALYSVLTYFAASRMIDYVIEGIQAYTGVTIISGESEIIKHKLVNELGRGITVYKGERGFLPGKFELSTNCDIIFTVVTRLELRKLKNLVYETDQKAFIFVNTIREASGGILKRRQSH